MNRRSEERTAAIVIRAWTEVGSPGRMKIRILTAPGGDTPAQSLAMTTEIEHACSLVRVWLESLSDDRPEVHNGAVAQSGETARAIESDPKTS